MRPGEVPQQTAKMIKQMNNRNLETANPSKDQTDEEVEDRPLIIRRIQAPLIQAQRILPHAAQQHPRNEPVRNYNLRSQRLQARPIHNCSAISYKVTCKTDWIKTLQKLRDMNTYNNPRYYYLPINDDTDIETDNDISKSD